MPSATDANIARIMIGDWLKAKPGAAPRIGAVQGVA